jgi:hypothetical protein
MLTISSLLSRLSGLPGLEPEAERFRHGNELRHMPIAEKSAENRMGNDPGFPIRSMRNKPRRQVSANLS